jgi:hypothetical protein
MSHSCFSESLITFLLDAALLINENQILFNKAKEHDQLFCLIRVLLTELDNFTLGVN